MVESMLISVSVESSDLLHLNCVAVVEESIFCDNLLFELYGFLLSPSGLLCTIDISFCVVACLGACRASFHPICAREARHRMEIWGKFGCDDVSYICLILWFLLWGTSLRVLVVYAILLV